MASSELPCFLYRLRATDGALLYIGITGNPALRIGQHAKSQRWWAEVQDVQVEQYPTRAAAAEAEIAAIRAEVPRYNTTGSTINKPAPPKPRPAPAPDAYVVTAKRWALGWELHITDHHGTEIGVTQVRSLSGVEAVARDYLALDGRGTDAGNVDVVIRCDLDAETIAALAEVRRLREEAERAQEAAAEAARRVVRRLQEDGLRGVDIAWVLGVSTQRVSQLMKDRSVKESA